MAWGKAGMNKFRKFKKEAQICAVIKKDELVLGKVAQPCNPSNLGVT
jgi:hypothetical protein